MVRCAGLAGTVMLVPWTLLAAESSSCPYQTPGTSFFVRVS